MADCPTCQGNGEIIVDWDRYIEPHPGDRGDEAVEQCPNCNGYGKVGPHHYSPSVMHMGDCYVCGCDQDHPNHIKPKPARRDLFG